MLKKLVIIIINPLINYLIVKITYANFLLISRLIVLGIEFKVIKKTSFISNRITKPGEKNKT